MNKKYKYGYCPYCGRYMPSEYNRFEHIRDCKSLSDEVREIHCGDVKENKKNALK